MSLCRLMINDFQGTDDDICKYNVGYDNYDLECGISYARAD